MLMPDDVDELLVQGISTDEIEELRLFYNMLIKERSLETILTSIETLMKDFHSLDDTTVVDHAMELPSERQMNYMNTTS